MAYKHIDNLYKSQDILQFPTCYAMEKIHGTSAHISYKTGGYLKFYSGGGNHQEFVNLFNHNYLLDVFKRINLPPHKSIHIYGESYGGKMQGMKGTYGDISKFVAFEVKIGDKWLSVPEANFVVNSLLLEFVYWEICSTELPALEAQRDSISIQAIRNGMGFQKDKFGFTPPIREGVVLRPKDETILDKHGQRIVAKFKRDEFSEYRTPKKVNQESLELKLNAEAIVNEWVTRERLFHVLDAYVLVADIKSTGDVIKAMRDDIYREAKGEILESKAVERRIGRATAILFKAFLKEELK